MVSKYGMGAMPLGFWRCCGGCADTRAARLRAAAAAAAAKSLYDRLGGKPAITAVVDQFVANVAADGRINNRFATTDIPS